MCVMTYFKYMSNNNPNRYNLKACSVEPSTNPLSTTIVPLIGRVRMRW